MNPKARRWLIAVGYVLLIYATLGVARTLTNILRAHGILRLSLSVVHGVCVALLSGYIVRNAPKALWRYIALLSLMGLYVAVAQKTVSPEEQIHFLQYGLVGIFFLRALELHVERKAAAYFFALVLASAAGWLDEIIQGLIPNRHYDVKDIFLNIVSAALGLAVFAVLPKKMTYNSSTTRIFSSSTQS